jgi:hypothetical protein
MTDVLFSVGAQLIDAITAAAQDALPYVLVKDGFVEPTGPGDILMVGYDDDGAPSITMRHDFVTTGSDGAISEVGDIICTAASWIGNPDDQKTPRDAVFAIAAAIANLCRIRGGTDPAFGVERALWTVCGSENESQFDQYHGAGGRVATLKFRIRYEARP